jgi:uncharacterized metal-binding protein
MPGHKTHDVIGAITSAPFAWGAYVIGYNIHDDTHYALALGTAFAASHLFSTFFMSPDMDLNSRVYNRWGVLKALWSPYKHLVRHRSKFSHSALGGIIRSMYLLGLVAVFWLALNGFAQVIDNIFLEATLKKLLMHIWSALIHNGIDSLLLVAAILLGSASASWVHVIADHWRPD